MATALSPCEIDPAFDPSAISVEPTVREYVLIDEAFIDDVEIDEELKLLIVPKGTLIDEALIGALTANAP